MKVNEVEEELGVQYALKGSIQKSSDKVRVNAQLVDAVKGHHCNYGKVEPVKQSQTSVGDIFNSRLNQIPNSRSPNSFND